MQIYLAGKLLFCDHIFNGYGNARKDFKKQLMKSRVEALQGFSLPKDFRFRWAGSFNLITKIHLCHEITLKKFDITFWANKNSV